MGAGSNFWSSTTVDPKRSFRWILIFDQIPTYVVKTVAKPSFTITNIAHNYIGHTFNYPGKITWNEVAVTLVDPVYPDASAKIIKILQASGYAIPGTEEAATISFSKANAVAALGIPAIAQLDAEGRIVDQWSLYNAWIQDAKFGELAYNTDEMLNVSVTFRYDWAQYEGAPQNANNPIPQLIMGNGPDQAQTINKYREEMGATGL
jgi:hypothetical protein